MRRGSVRIAVGTAFAIPGTERDAPLVVRIVVAKILRMSVAVMLVQPAVTERATRRRIASRAQRTAVHVSTAAMVAVTVQRIAPLVPQIVAHVFIPSVATASATLQMGKIVSLAPLIAM